jgi:hypothetical protein
VSEKTFNTIDDVPNIRDREWSAFTTDTDGKIAKRVVMPDGIDANVVFSGLQIGFKITTMTIGDTEVAIPATALTDRNSFSLVNLSETDTLYLGNTGVTADRVTGITSGWEVGPNESFNIDITEDIIMYGICESGKTVQIKLFEVA